MSELSSETNYEKPRDFSTDFEVSIDRLYALIDQDDSSSYFRVAWDASLPGKIESLEIMEATPTGARKQERKGKYNQAQFIVRTHDDNGIVSEPRFEWLRTGLKSPGTAIEAHDESLYEDFGYRYITSEEVTDALVGQATTLRDFMSLMNTAKERGIELPDSFVRGLKSANYRTLYENGSTRLRQLHELALDDVFELIQKLDEVDENLSSQIQGKVINRLAEPFRPYNTSYRTMSESDNNAQKDQAASIIESALADGRLSDTSRVVYKLLETPGLYEYRFATDLLYRELTERRYGASLSRNSIFSLKREYFIAEFMKSVVAGESRKATVDFDEQFYIAKYTNNDHSWAAAPKQRNQNDSDLIALANMLPDEFGMHSPLPQYSSKGEVSREDQELKTSKSYKAFERTLTYLHNSTQDSQPDDEQYVTKCLEIVRILQRPFIVSNLAKKAVKQTQDSKKL